MDLELETDVGGRPGAGRGRRHGRPGPAALLALAGAAGAGTAALLSPSGAQAAAEQDWPPFLLVAGLLLIGLVAGEDRLFAAAGHRLAGIARSGRGLFAGGVAMIAVVTAVLNLDTSVAFLTPVLVHSARRRGDDEAPLLYGCILLSNAASLLLPGSNLTNLIVLGDHRMPGGAFLAHTAPAWAVAVVATAAVVAIAERSSLRRAAGALHEPDRPVLGLGLAAVAAAVVLVLLLRSPALPVACLGVLAVGVRVAQGRERPRRALEALGLPVLVGLLGVAVALGTAGRAWSGPAQVLGHLDIWATAGFAAVTSVLVNNLPAASLLSARPSGHPFALLVGLDIGPNFFVTGSLAWILWLRAARSAGSSPSLWRGAKLGSIAAVVAIAAAVGVLAAG